MLRLNDFHLFRSLYGESFSRSLQETFASSVRSCLQKVLPHDPGCVSMTRIVTEPGEQALVWYDPNQRTDGPDIAFSLRKAVNDDLSDIIERRTGQSLHILVGQAERRLPLRDNAWRSSFFSCLEEARCMTQSGLNKRDMLLNAEFQEILAQSRIEPRYQPIVHMNNGSVFGWEALSRGPGESNFHSPLSLFQFAEETGGLFQLERVCREKAITHCRDFIGTGKLFLNIHPQTISDPDFTPGETKRMLEKTRIDPENVVFEITERHAVENFQLFHDTLQHYRNQGFLVAVDDVGSGYSGLQSIARIRPDFIKIDKSLVVSADSDPVKRALLETFVTFADQIGAKIIAEGIETSSVFATLANFGVHFGQGYYIAKPDYPPRQVDLSRETAKTPRSNQESSRCNLPVGKLARSVPTVDQGTTVEEVRTSLDSLGPLGSIVVEQKGTPAGLIMSHHLTRQLSTLYGVALYSKRDVTCVMDHDPLIVDESEAVEYVARMTTLREKDNAYDDIVVTRRGELLGVVSVHQLVESMASLQVEMAKGSNPLTGLSGNLALESEMEKRIDLGRPFYVVYADLDHFKAYNDTYGFQHGDQMILLLARILQRCQRRYGEPSDFIGHVGGDDFVLVTSADPERACRGVTRCFQRASRGCYTERDRERGCMEAQTREGGTARFSLVTVSLGILRVEGSTTLQRISERAAEVKKYAKSQTGNSVLRDRRAPLATDERSG
ncbi:MAG: EAL and GGDEF domain-containing protein [Desulfohalobiaceae bacterium]|nr:EAL and GGDEF domain-containing protein [Desulfohalobiaceae bacterium]